MSLLNDGVQFLPYVFHPTVMIGGATLLLLYHEWNRQDAERETLWRRVAAFLGAGVLAFVPTVAYILVTGTGPLATTQGNAWQVDTLVGSGILVAAGVTWYLWQRNDWGALVPGEMQVLALTTVPYLALSPVWNVSGHVLLALVPVLYLTLVERKFFPLLAIPVVMVPNRVALGAHTWAQSIGGFLLGVVVVVGLYWLQTGSVRPEPESAIL